MATRKTFLLVMQEYSDFPDLFVKNLEKAGFQAFTINDKIADFYYRGIERLMNFHKKTFLKDENFKDDLKENFKLDEFKKKLDKLPETFDYILVIRPDMFPIPFIQYLKTKTSKLIAYQWDGIEKFPEIKHYYSLFDSFFSFENISDGNGIQKITNFYFDLEQFDPSQDLDTGGPTQFYFIGLDWENRREMIDKFVEFAVENSFVLNFYLQEYEPNDHKNQHINYIKDRITFSENIDLVKKADVLLDFLDSRHIGLAIRFFEGMYYKKKVITNNKMIKNYDFYHPNNIFILENNYEDITEFLAKPYFDISEKIVKKYSFTSWINTIIE